MQVVYGRQSPVTSTSSSLHDRFDFALRALLTTDDWHPEAPLAVALSGGTDSMACTLLMQEYVRQHGLRMVTLTVDHGLRAESRAEAEQVAAWMRRRGIQHHILTPAHRDVSRNMQEAARIWRYDALVEYCTYHGITHCLVAHHAGDNRETLLHQQQRDKTHHHAGMPRSRTYRGVRFLRPMLGFEREEIEHFVRTNVAAWIEDPSNQNEKFTRVRNRNLLQQNTALRETLDATLTTNIAAQIDEDRAFTQAAARCVHVEALGYATIDLAAWRALSPPLARRVIADCLTTIGGHTHRPRARDTARLIQALQHHGFRKRTLHHCEIAVHDSTVTIARELSRVETPATLEGSGNLTWDNRFRVTYHITNGKRYTLCALGPDGRKQLTTRALPLATPSLWHLDELVHVPYINAAPYGLDLALEFVPAKPLAPATF